jgi:hypothetical protein
MWTLAHVWDRKRFILLFRLGVDSLYIATYKESMSKGFQVVMTLSGILAWGLLGWKLFARYGWIENNFTGYMKSVTVIMGYLLLKWVLEYFLSVLFDIQRYYPVSFFVKLSYGNSYSMYLTLLMIPWFYTFKDSDTYNHFMEVIAVFFIVLRYYQYISLYKKMITSRIFYFILYFCTLEIAPIIWLVKTVFNLRGI